MLDYRTELENFDIINCSRETVTSIIKRFKRIISCIIICISLILIYLITKITLMYFEFISFNLISILLIDLVLYELFRLYFLRNRIKMYLLVFEAILENNINE
jgi:hypothetical protein